MINDHKTTKEKTAYRDSSSHFRVLNFRRSISNRTYGASLPFQPIPDIQQIENGREDIQIYDLCQLSKERNIPIRYLLLISYDGVI